MNFIDIASHQAGIDLAAVFARNPELDGAIVKATEGSTYVNPYCDGWVQILRRLERPWGFYHYIVGGDPIAEADFLWENAKNYFGEGVPCADYEAEALAAGTGYLKKFLDRIYELSGVKMPVYCSLISTLQNPTQDFTAIADAGYPLWVAQYANMYPTGIQECPWQNGSVAPFKGYIMHQYTSNGVLTGWAGRLDMDKVWLTEEQWDALAQGEPMIPEPTVLKSADPQVVYAVLCNEYGVKGERVRKLQKAGYDPESVQAKINELYGIAASVRPMIGDNLNYIDCIYKIAADMR